MPASPDWQARRLARALSPEDQPFYDPWSRVSLAPFEITPQEMLARARRESPPRVAPTVSDFTGWLYSLYTKEFSREGLRKGKEAETEVLSAKQVCGLAPDFRSFRSPIWKLLHCGMGDPDREGVPQTFEIPPLRVNGTPLRACPDLVFENQDNGTILLIEVKFTMRVIPINLWPNVWAQLWSYSKIPQYFGTPLIAVGEIWGENTGGWSRRGLDSLVYLRHSVRRDPRAPAFERFFRRLFELYGGTVMYTAAPE